MNSSQGFLIAVATLTLAVACNQQPAPGTQTTAYQTAPTPPPSPTNAPASIEANRGDPSFKPKHGYVPDEQTAIAIAVAVWTPIYGKEQIETEKPYHATLKDGVWTVIGSLHEGYNGGTAFAEIAQTDGRVLRVIHYQ